MSDDESLRALGKQLPWDRPDAARAANVRASLLVQIDSEDERARVPRRRWLVAGGGFAAGLLVAAGVMLVISLTSTSKSTSTSAQARVDAPADARLDHRVTKTPVGTDEVVRVRTGTVRIGVPTLRSGDRVRVQTSDAEVEGTGSYEVMVVADSLARVSVREGSATVRVRAQQIVLAAGQTWQSTIQTATLYEAPPVSDAPGSASELAAGSDSEPVPAPASGADSEPASVPAPVSDSQPASAPALPAARASGATVARGTPTTNVPASSEWTARDRAAASKSTEQGREPLPAVTELSTLPDPPRVATRAGRTASPTEQHFQRGWSLLRAGKPREAIPELAAAAAADELDPLAADARYFQAIALVRIGSRREAEGVLVAFLDRAPRSLRRGRAAVLLGSLIRDRGDRESARRWFESALGDGDPAVAAAARSHLDALAPR